jgi:hypothetical protein
MGAAEDEVPDRFLCGLTAVVRPAAEAGRSVIEVLIVRPGSDASRVADLEEVLAARGCA